MPYKERYQAKNSMTCQQCNAKMLAANTNQKYCAVCIIDRMTESRRKNQARARAKRLAEKAAANGHQDGT